MFPLILFRRERIDLPREQYHSQPMSIVRQWENAVRASRKVVHTHTRAQLRGSIARSLMAVNVTTRLRRHPKPIGLTTFCIDIYLLSADSFFASGLADFLSPPFPSII